MKKNVLLLGLLLTFFSCMTPITRAYNWRFSLEKPQPSETLSFSDDYVDITFALEGVTDVSYYSIVKDAKEIGFEIQNKTDRGIKINWDDISIIYPDGKASRVIHGGVKLIEKASIQAPTIVPPNARVSDILVPTENISSTTYGWNTAPLFGGENRLIWNDKEFSIFFPLEIKGEKKEYTFKFKINVSLPAPEIKK